MAQTYLTNQGNLNRLRAKINVKGFYADVLSIDYNSLGAEGVRLTFDDNATDLLPTMAGMVSSPRPYMGCTLTVAIVKSVPVAAAYQQAFQTTTLLGEVDVVPDTGVDPTSGGITGVQMFQLFNMALEGVREMSFAGNEAAIVVTMKGFYPVNQNFFF